MKFTTGFVAAMAILASATSVRAETRVCSKYSTILLSDGENAEVNGAGHSSLSLFIKGPRGNWIFFDSISEPAEADTAGTLVVSEMGIKAYRRSHNARIYAVHQATPSLTDGKMVKTGVMGVDAMLEPLDNAAVVGEDSDFDIIKKVLPGVVDRCDLRFVAGQGLVATPDAE